MTLFVHSAIRSLFNSRYWLLAAAAVMQTAVAAPADDRMATPEQRYQLALEARTERDYGAMLAQLRSAAAGGDRAAREMLASVLLVGPALYGKAVRIDHCEAAHWMRLSAAQGSAVGKHQLLMLNGMRDLPGGRNSCKTVKTPE